MSDPRKKNQKHSIFTIVEAENEDLGTVDPVLAEVQKKLEEMVSAENKPIAEKIDKTIAEKNKALKAIAEQQRKAAATKIFQELLQGIKNLPEVDWKDETLKKAMILTFANRLPDNTEEQRFELTTQMLRKGAPHDGDMPHDEKHKAHSICDEVRADKNNLASPSGKLLLLVESLFNAFKIKNLEKIENALHEIAEKLQKTNDGLIQICKRDMALWKNKRGVHS